MPLVASALVRVGGDHRLARPGQVWPAGCVQPAERVACHRREVAECSGQGIAGAAELDYRRSHRVECFRLPVFPAEVVFAALDADRATAVVPGLAGIGDRERCAKLSPARAAAMQDE